MILLPSTKKILDEIYNDLIRCTQCNLCILGCPLFMGSRYDHFSPRAIILLTKDYIEGKIGIDSFLSFLIYMCNLCGNCDVRCPSRIKITNIVSNIKKLIAGGHI